MNLMNPETGASRRGPTAGLLEDLVSVHGSSVDWLSKAECKGQNPACGFLVGVNFHAEYLKNSSGISSSFRTCSLASIG